VTAARDLRGEAFFGRMPADHDHPPRPCCWALNVDFLGLVHRHQLFAQDLDVGCAKLSAEIVNGVKTTIGISRSNHPSRALQNRASSAGGGTVAGDRGIVSLLCGWLFCRPIVIAYGVIASSGE